MIERLLDIIKEKYTLCELDVGEFFMLKANGMKFTVEAYYAEWLGHISVMKAKGFFGFMRMDTFMVVPREKDLPLYSYDRIYIDNSKCIQCGACVYQCPVRVP